jgi:predicted small lipoprotein YifL
VRFVMSRFDRLFPPLAAVALALLLAGCGLKGALDPPPSATPAQVATTPGAEPPPEGETKPQAARKRVFLDWLLD